MVTDQGRESGTVGSAEGGAGGWVQGTWQLLGLGGQHGPSKGSTKARTTRGTTRARDRGTTRARDRAGGNDWDGKTQRGPCPFSQAQQSALQGEDAPTARL